MDPHSYTDPTDLLVCWCNHFEAPGQSRYTSAANSHILDSYLLFQASFAEVLDDILSLEEVKRAVFSLKIVRVGGLMGSLLNT